MLAGPPLGLEDPFLLQDLDDLALLIELGEAVRTDEVVLLELEIGRASCRERV
jgi:hypothetical protein